MITIVSIRRCIEYLKLSTSTGKTLEIGNAASGAAAKTYAAPAEAHLYVLKGYFGPACKAPAVEFVWGTEVCKTAAVVTKTETVTVTKEVPVPTPVEVPTPIEVPTPVSGGRADYAMIENQLWRGPADAAGLVSKLVERIGC